MSALLNFLMTWNDDGKVARTLGLLTEAPLWDQLPIDAETFGKVNDCALDWHCEYVITEGASGRLGAYVVTTLSSSLHVLYVDNLQTDDPSEIDVVYLMTYTMNDSSVQTSARVAVSRAERGFIGIAWKDRTGTRVGRSTDGGETWDTAVRVGSAITDTIHDNDPVGFAIEGVHQLVTGPDSNEYYGLYLATSETGSFSLLSGSPTSKTPWPMVMVENGIVYATQPAQEFTYSVTFDSVNDAEYDNVNGNIDSSGNPGNAYLLVSGELGGQGYVLVDLGSPKRVTKVQYQAYGDWYAFWVAANDVNNLIATTTNSTSGWTDQDHAVNESNTTIIYFSIVLTAFETTRLDNILITAVSQNELYRIDDYLGTPNWVAITPPDEYAPQNPYALAINTANQNTIDMIGKVNSTSKWFTSINQGSDWNDEGSFNHVAIRRSGHYILASGASGLVMSGDDGDSFANKTGNLASVLDNDLGSLRGMVDSLWLYQDFPACDHEALSCPLSFNENDPIVLSSNPVTYRLGEKRERVTDMTVNTPGGGLALIRSYRQQRQSDPDYQFMGQGWTHNHYGRLRIEGTLNTSGSNIVALLAGGELHLAYNATSQRYESAPGSNSYLVYDNTASSDQQFVLTVSDKSTYTFDDDQQLRYRDWPSGERWIYTYNNGQLSEVVDDSYLVDTSLKRKLVFVYHSGGDHDGQLRYVGDHTFSASPLGGRYVQYDYSLRKTVDEDGDIVADSGATNSLLTEVRDTRGQTWVYEYYGQDISEADTQQLNLLVRHLSPEVTVNGSPTTLTLHNTTYSLTVNELGSDGDMETDDGTWTAIVAATQAQVSSPIHTSPGHSRSVEADEDDGIQGNPWDMVADRTYIIRAWVYLDSASSGHVKMAVTDESAFDVELTTTDAWKMLHVLYTPSTDGNERRLQFLAVGGAAQFYVDDVSISELGVTQIVQERGDAALTTEYQFGGDIMRETTAELETTHRFAGEVYLSAQNPKQQTRYTLPSSVYRPKAQVDPNGHETRLTWGENGRHLEQITDALGHRTRFGYAQDDRLYESVDAEGKRTLYYYADPVNPRQPTSILVTQSHELCTNPRLDNDSDWTIINTNQTAVNERLFKPLLAETGYYVRHVMATDVDQGIEGQPFDLVEDRTYVIYARVYPLKGTVRMQVSDETVFDVASSGTDAWETLAVLHKVSANATDKRVQFVVNALDNGEAEFYIDSVSVVETDDLILNGNMEEDAFWSSYGSPATNEPSDIQVDRDQYSRYVDADDSYGIESYPFDLIANRVYVAVARVYRETGSAPVKLQITGTTGFDLATSGDAEVWETLYIVYQPTTDLSNCKLQLIADGGQAGFYVDNVHVIDGVSILRWQELTYDVKGRTLSEQTRDPVDGVAPLQEVLREYYDETSPNNGLLKKVTQTEIGGSNDVTTTYSYDSAGRVNKVQKNSNFGGCEISFSLYDEAGNVIASICNYDPGSDPDPTTVEEALDLYDSNVPDKNRITVQVYDALGRRTQTTTNAGADFAQASVMLYDALSRVWRSIGNFVDDDYADPDLWVFEDGQWKDSPSGVEIQHGSYNNENIISDTVFNERGLVRLRRDILGNVTLFGYDAADRLVKTVVNASDPDYDNSYNPTTGDYDLSAYEPSDPNDHRDQDVITRQEYDAAGNLVKTIDTRGVPSFTVYDALNRGIKTVRYANNDAQIDLNPGDEGYDPANDPRSDDYGVSLEPSVDLIEETEYDAMGRVVRSRRMLENRDDLVEWDVTLFGYDALGRQVKVIRSAKTPDYDIVADPDLSEYTEDPSPDGDFITQTVYDNSGRVQVTEDVNGTQTRSVYDGFGRQVKTIANYVAQGSSDPKDWVWDVTDNRWEDGTGNAIDHGANNDQNSISETVYDADGRVTHTRNVAGQVNLPVYDSLGRQLKSITNYVPHGSPETDPASWVWDEGQTRWETASGDPISHGSRNDQNVVSETMYDAQGRVLETRDARGNVTRNVYDTTGRRIRGIQNYVDQGEDPALWVWNNGWKKNDGTTPIAQGTDNDHNLISDTIYDIAGRVTESRDAAGNLTRNIYDGLGRRIRTIQNYVDQGEDPALWIWNNGWKKNDGTTPISQGSQFDHNLISETLYDRFGSTTTTRDVRGTQTRTDTDYGGRRVSIWMAVNTNIESFIETGYDKVGRVRRTFVNPQDFMDENGQYVLLYEREDGQWRYQPTQHGVNNDENLITEFIYDATSRRVQTINPAGGETTTLYFKDGQVDRVVDPEGIVTAYRYDGQRRRTLVVQNYVPQGSPQNVDPENWVWNGSNERWELSASDDTAVDHGEHNDTNIVVQVIYDPQGRMVGLREPRGNLHYYAYDQLGRRITRVMNYVPQTNQSSQVVLPEDWVWDATDERWELGDGTPVDHNSPNYALDQNLIRKTAYVDSGHVTQMILTDMKGWETTRTTDRLGRLLSLTYGDPATTPDVKFAYDIAGNRTQMTEYGGAGFTDPVRDTQYSYDDARRLTSVGYDDDGGGTVDEIVSYEYDLGGLRTQLTLPGNLIVTYTYDDKGRLVGLTDWDGHESRFAYDRADRQTLTVRPNQLRSRYHYDLAGRLKRLKHDTKAGKILADFQYDVDKRGNRTQARELLVHPATTNDTVLNYDDSSIVYKGEWSDEDPFKVSTRFSAGLSLVFVGSEATFTVGTGPDHSIFDVYIGHSLWQSFDGYSATPDELPISVTLEGEGPHFFEIRNRAEKNLASTGFKLRFKELVVEDMAYDFQTIQYNYDGLSRIANANYYPGINTGATPLKTYTYEFDRAGNRTQEVISNGTTTTHEYDYNLANQISQLVINSGTPINFAYDVNGNLTSDGTNTYVWDRANRLLSMGGHSYAYNGNGIRVSQTVSSVVTQYLLDTQPGLAMVLSSTVSGITTRYIHGPMGIFAQEDNSGVWTWPLPDGLRSVRSISSNGVSVLGVQNYSLYGVPDVPIGTVDSVFRFTGEMRDGNEVQYHRARYLNTAIGGWASLDPFEGMMNRPMSLNGYSWVEGNIATFMDARGDVPTEDSIKSRNSIYSCKCGWLDVRHIRTFGPRGNQIRQAVFEPISTLIKAGGGDEGRMIRVPELRLEGPFSIILNFWTYIPNKNLRDEYEKEKIALGIFFALSREHENVQASVNPTAEALSDPSGYSEEDLPSNLIGYYLAKNGLDLKPDFIKHSKFEELCGVIPDIDITRKMYDYYQGNFGFSLSWKDFFKRNNHQPLDGPFSMCNNDFSFPSQLMSEIDKEAPSTDAYFHIPGQNIPTWVRLPLPFGASVDVLSPFSLEGLLAHDLTPRIQPYDIETKYGQTFSIFPTEADWQEPDKVFLYAITNISYSQNGLGNC